MPNAQPTNICSAVQHLARYETASIREAGKGVVKLTPKTSPSSPIGRWVQDEAMRETAGMATASADSIFSR